ncbi:metal-dependent hydrolase [Thiorhodovibrio frisius]|uniref:Putative membrane-bound metal-dependent hydrolase (DUF457) n=1 Tax=Thiorhodovibrio frisius TaxID=631362 RepID=H8Z7Z2_9GAMM|nr:metal-dependent hydrolase [Thiorhodovibrio frisius]EIC21004.1 putative membrane-bound metal-dependent hydrolase (DUF457) [Thiorhodovibrio frisius]WPL22060.1 hypothetical protein Thiofri_02211 [Thiorhodovibrio frisius]
MANFQTHLGVGTAVVGTAALAIHTQGLADFSQTQWLLALGVAASLLPDIDADDSRPVRAFFGLLGLVLGFVIASRLRDHFRLLELALVWAGVWLLVNFPLRLFFARLTVHRGSFHSLLMALAIALFVVIGADRWFAFEPAFSWLVGGFVLLGYLTHLVLDEIASVDLLGNRVKRSFGTAIKPLSLRAWPLSLLLLGLIGVGALLVPDPAPLVQFLQLPGIFERLPEMLPASFG